MSDLEREPDPWVEQATERWERLEDQERAEELWRDRLTRDAGESGGRKPTKESTR